MPEMELSNYSGTCLDEMVQKAEKYPNRQGIGWG